MPYRDGFAARISEKNRVKKKNRDIDMNTFSKFLDRSVLVSARIITSFKYTMMNLKDVYCQLSQFGLET